MASADGTSEWSPDMSDTTSSLMTADELARLASDGKRYRLIRGELQMMSPAGGRHGRIAQKLLRRLGNYVEDHGLGETFAAETGFLIETDPDTVRAPDASFVSMQKLGDWADHSGYLPLAPDLAAEVVSPTDSSSEVEAKAAAWLRAGVRLVLVVDPQTKSVRQYRTGKDIQVHDHGHIDLGDVLPGFTLDVGDLFS